MQRRWRGPSQTQLPHEHLYESPRTVEIKRIDIQERCPTDRLIVMIASGLPLGLDIDDVPRTDSTCVCASRKQRSNPPNK